MLLLLSACSTIQVDLKSTTLADGSQVQFALGATHSVDATTMTQMAAFRCTPGASCVQLGEVQTSSGPGALGIIAPAASFPLYGLFVRPPEFNDSSSTNTNVNASGGTTTSAGGTSNASGGTNTATNTATANPVVTAEGGDASPTVTAEGGKGGEGKGGNGGDGGQGYGGYTQSSANPYLSQYTSNNPYVSTNANSSPFVSSNASNYAPTNAYSGSNSSNYAPTSASSFNSNYAPANASAGASNYAPDNSFTSAGASNYTPVNNSANGFAQGGNANASQTDIEDSFNSKTTIDASHDQCVGFNINQSCK